MTTPTRNNKLSFAVKLAIVAGSAPMLGASNVAFAQDDAAGYGVEEVVTTGSRIKRADIESASPVTVLERDDILAMGLTDVGNLIQSMPSMSGSPIGTTTNNGGNGSVLVDLRGLGVNRTLTLVNGQRVVDGGDYQTIPATMIERVEILKDGASAVYGADAVAGVVNIITRQNFEGFQIEAQNADFFDLNDGEQNQFGFIAGTSFDGGNVVFGGEFVKQTQAYQSDAPWDYFQDSYFIYPELGCESNPTLPYGQGGCYPLGSSRIPESRLRFVDPDGAGPLTSDTYMIEVPGQGLVPFDGRTYNYAPVNYIQTPYERLNLFGEANFDINEYVRFKSSVRANLRTSAQELAPQPYNSPTDPSYQGTFNGTAYSGISEDNFYLAQATAAAGLPQVPVQDARRRMVETPRRFEQDITQVQATFGLEGSVGDYDWDISYNRGHRSRSDNDFGQFNGTNLANAMGPSADLDGDGNPECYQDINDPATLIAGCVPFNFFGGAGTVTDEMLNYVGVDLVDSFVTELEEVIMGVGGSAFELPGGELGWYAGYNYRREAFTFSPDSAKQLDQVTGNTGVGTNGSLYSSNFFAEVLAPVWDNGTQNVTLKGGVRYDDYNTFGDETTWQFGAEFQAIDSLKLRATFGTVFRVPTITDLFAGLSDSFPTYADPCVPPAGQALPPGCNGQVGLQLDNQVLARVGGNPNLIPETGDTFTAGVVWTPSFGDADMTLTVDYWNTQLDDGISSLGVQFILDDCYVRQNAASCALITRRADGSIAQILDGNLNVAEQGASGVDTEFRYNFDTGFGQFETSLLWAYLIERTKTPDPTTPEFGLQGRYTDPTAEDGGAYSRNKINYAVQWYKDGLSIGYMGEYIHDLLADTSFCCVSGTGVQKIDSQLYHDLVGSYDFGQGTTISAGITNFTDEEPPFIDIGFNASTDPSTYRLFGIGYYLRLSHAIE